MRFTIAILFAAAAFAQNTGRVEGRVISTTGEPIRKATVRIQTAQGGFAETTGADGSFVIAGVAPGRYAVSADKAGFAQRPYSSIVVNVTAGETERIDIQLRPLAVISGRVVDEEGDPLPAVRVTTMRYRWVGADLGVQRGAATTADDRGEFRIANLEPGRYFLLAEDAVNGLRNSLIAGQFSGAAAQRISLPTYFPSEENMTRAVAVEAKAGMESAGLVIRVRRGDVFSARGRAIDTRTGEPVGGTIRAIPRDGSGQGRSSSGIRNPAEGFEIRGLTPGAYLLQLTIADAANRGRQLSGETEAIIGTGDVEGIVLRVTPSVDLPGRVIVEGGDYAALLASPTQAPPPRGFFGGTVPVNAPKPSVNLVRRGPAGAGGGYTSQIAPDGSFEMKNLRPGRYNLNMSALPRSYLKAVRAGGAEYVDTLLDFSVAVAGPVEIVLGTDGATIAPSQLPPVAEGEARSLALWPVKPRLIEQNAGVRVFLAANANARIANVAPGDYYFALFDTADLQTLQAYGFLAQFNELATKVTLEPGATVTAEPKLIPRAAVEAVQ